MTAVGYARTSTADQQAGLADQVAQLQAAGCTRIWQEHVSALSSKRPELTAALNWCREGDVFTVTKPDRLARSVVDLLATVAKLKARGVTVRIISMGVDTGSPTSNLMLSVLGAVAEFEREIMLERQRAGIRAARDAGKYKGRKRKADGAEAARLKAQGVPVAEIARRMDVNVSNVWRALRDVPAAV